VTSQISSIILLTYNQENFVEDAFLSLLKQDTDNIEIVVSDDCSSDATWEIIQAVAKDYLGQKKIILSRNSSNVGIIDNYAAAVKRSSGGLIFMAAGDDVSLPDRCSKTIQFWLDNKQQYDLVATDAFDMAYNGKILSLKENDNLEDWNIKKWFERRPFFFGSSHMVTKKLLNLAPLSNQLPYEDQCLVFRAILMGGAIRLPTPLICHRRGGMTQESGIKFGHRRSEITRDMSREITELQQFLGDATVLGRRSNVEDLVNKKLAYCDSILTLFSSTISFRALWIFWNSAEVSVHAKRRYSRYYLLYPLLSIAHGLRDLLRILKNANHFTWARKSKN
jgi:glycosyltransferase involved in cell wall biosynthesis